MLWTAAFAGFVPALSLRVGDPHNNPGAVLGWTLGAGLMLVAWGIGTIILGILAIATKPSPSVPWPRSTKWAAGVVTVIVFFWTFSAMVTTNPGPQVTASSPIASMPKPINPVAVDGWRVDRSISAMDSSKTVTLALDAENEIDAWLGSKKPILIIRCKERKTEVYIASGTAASVESAENSHTVRLRFDDAKPATAHWPASTDEKALFAPEAMQLARKLSQTNRLTFEFTPFQASPAQAIFNLNGLANHLGEIGQACGWAGIDQAKARAEAADAILRNSLAQYVHPCHSESFAGKWCWTDPTDVLYKNEMTAFDSGEQALNGAVKAEKSGLAFLTKK